jgi:retinol dehydrogenase-12
MAPKTRRRIAIVTGANAGIGKETALALASPPHDFHVIMGCRSEARGEAAAGWIQSRCASASVRVVHLDTSDFSSVKQFSGIINDLGAIHVLVLNAGVGGMGTVPTPTADGADECYRINFVGHFLLTQLLHTSLAKANGARVVCVSSVMHRFGSPDWLSPLKFSSRSNTYSVSKLAMAVLAAEISRRWGTEDIYGIAVSPGAVNSDIWYRGQLTWWQEAFIKRLFHFAFLTSEQGAACSVAAATDPQYGSVVEPGLYLCPYRTLGLPILFELHGPFAGARRCQPKSCVVDEEVGRSLWGVTSESVKSSL